MQGLITIGGIKPKKAIHHGITQLSGEIDVLCLDPQRSRIWVIEAKDPTKRFSPRRIRQLITDYHEEKGYVDKLLKKVQDIQNSAPSVAQVQGMSEREWNVIGLMVTRILDPAAFVLNARVPFCVFEDLTQVVQLDDLPGPGFVELPDESVQ